jgi:hypothetical protein
MTQSIAYLLVSKLFKSFVQLLFGWFFRGVHVDVSILPSFAPIAPEVGKKELEG